MRKTQFNLAAAATAAALALILSLAGCSKMEYRQDLPSQQQIVTADDWFDAVVDDSDLLEAEDSLLTKSTLGSANSLATSNIKWLRNDAITLMASSYKSGRYSVEWYTYRTAKGDGKFACTDATAPNRNNAYWYVSIYPANPDIKVLTGSGNGSNPTSMAIYTTLPAVQQYAPDSFGQDAYPMVAAEYGPKSLLYNIFKTFPSFTFKSVAGVLRLSVKAAVQTSVSSMTVTAPGAGISGKFEYADSKYVYAGDYDAKDSKVTLQCGGVSVGKTPKTFMVVLPVGTYSDATLTINTTDGKTYEYPLGRFSIKKAEFTDKTAALAATSDKYEIVSETVLTYDGLKEAMLEKNESLGTLFEWYARALYNVGALPSKETGRCYKSVVIRYPSVDTRGARVMLSGRLIMSCDPDGVVMDPQHIILDSRYTIGASSEAPSQMYLPGTGLAFQKGVLVQPDFLGFGASGSYDHPYLCPEMTAINALDMVRAAKAYVACSGAEISDRTPLYNLGYSQGGGSALAIQKYIETNNLLGEFNLCKTYCGGGVYSPAYFYKKMFETGTCAYPSGIPMMIMGMKTAYPELLTAPLEDYLSPTLVHAGIIGKVRSKALDVDQLADEIYKACNKTSIGVNDLLSAECATPGSELYNQVMAGLDRCELTTGWQPQTPVHFFHYEKDEIVSFEIYKLAKNAFTGSNCRWESVNYLILSDHRMNAGLFYARAIGGEFKTVK